MAGPTFGFGLSGSQPQYYTVVPGTSLLVGDTSLTNVSLVSGANLILRGGNVFIQNAAGNVDFMTVDATAIHGVVPFAGSSSDSKPFMLLSTTYAVSGSAVTLSAAQYQCCVQVATGTPGADRNVIAPTVTDGTWLFVNQTNNAQTFKTSGGTGISVATLKSAWLRCDGTNIVRLSGDF